MDRMDEMDRIRVKLGSLEVWLYGQDGQYGQYGRNEGGELRVKIFNQRRWLRPSSLKLRRDKTAAQPSV